MPVISLFRHEFASWSRESAEKRCQATVTEDSFNILVDISGSGGLLAEIVTPSALRIRPKRIRTAEMILLLQLPALVIVRTWKLCPDYPKCVQSYFGSGKNPSQLQPAMLWSTGDTASISSKTGKIFVKLLM
jgi:hypothetical protein